MEKITEILKQKLTSHNMFPIDQITISEDEYLELVSSVQKPSYIPERIIITIQRGTSK